MEPHTSTTLLLALLIPIGIGGGLTIPPLTTALLQATAADHTTFLRGLHTSALIGAITLLLTAVATILLLRPNGDHADTAA